MRFLLMAASAVGVVWFAAGAEPSDLRAAAERAVSWVQELPERARFRSPPARRGEAEAPPVRAKAVEEKPVIASDPVPPSMPAAAPASDEPRIEVERSPFAEPTPVPVDTPRDAFAPSARRPLSRGEAERVRDRLDRVMTLAGGRTP